MRKVLHPFVKREEPQHNFVAVECRGASADVYFVENSMLVQHVSDQRMWDLLVRGAREADWVILPTGCPPCITAESQRLHLPAELEEDARLVQSGTELLRVIGES